MLLVEPPPSPMDLNFRLLGIPVRVSPWFWLTAVLLGRGLMGSSLVVWILCVLLSILVHEFGHALTNRLFGDRPWIVLYGMGGICISRGEHRPWQRMIVVLGGPLAGFLLAGLAFGVTSATSQTHLSLPVRQTLAFLLLINIFWSVFNLIPIWPLDGGQFLMIVLRLLNRRKGERWAYTVGLLVAGILGIYLASQAMEDSSGGGWFNVIIVGLLAVTNYQRLQALHNAARYGIDEEW